MSKKPDYKLIGLLVLSVSFITTGLTAIFLTCFYSQVHFQAMGSFCNKVMEQCPDSREAVAEAVKSLSLEGPAFGIEGNDKNVMLFFGFRPMDLWRGNTSAVRITATAFMGFLAGSGLLAGAFWYWHRKSEIRLKTRIEMLTDYLEKINMGHPTALWDPWEDEFSRLQDEMYKTVTMLYQTRDKALKARKNFADNLSNIAHQLKTPITAISLCVQMMQEDGAAGQKDSGYSGRISGQLDRLARLEEGLLLLSGIDAGTLILERKSVDVFTVLMLAADNLQEMFAEAKVLADIPEMGKTEIMADPDWTMEAMMNLMKNCMEAAPAGSTVHCSYEENLLYVQIRVWDEGQGFEKEDLPHLFERFYRGRNSKRAGMGIGLSLAKEIVEMQGGAVSAFNRPEGGACFEVRFYRGVPFK